MIKTIKILLYSEIAVAIIFILSILFITSENYYLLPNFLHEFYKIIGFNYELIGFNKPAAVAELIIALIGIILPLIAIYKRSKTLRIISIVLIGLLVISYSVGGYFAIIGTIIFIFFLTTPVKKYFGYNSKENLSLDKNY